MFFNLWKDRCKISHCYAGSLTGIPFIFQTTVWIPTSKQFTQPQHAQLVVGVIFGGAIDLSTVLESTNLFATRSDHEICLNLIFDACIHYTSNIKHFLLMLLWLGGC